MINALKFIVSCECLGLEERFKGVVLAMLFLKHANMVQQMKKYARISNMSLLNLHMQIHINALVGQKI